MDAALEDSTAAGLPPIAVTANQGKLLHLLVRLAGARTVLELGTLGGYSTIWLARALPADGRLFSLEANPHYAEVAQANIARAGLEDLVELRIGPALETFRCSRRRVLGRLTSFSLTPTSRTTPAISNGRSSSLVLARSLSATTSCATGRSSIRSSPIRIAARRSCRACVASMRCSPLSLA